MIGGEGTMENKELWIYLICNLVEVACCVCLAWRNLVMWGEMRKLKRELREARKNEDQ